MPCTFICPENRIWRYHIRSSEEAGYQSIEVNFVEYIFRVCYCGEFICRRSCALFIIRVAVITKLLICGNSVTLSVYLALCTMLIQASQPR